MAESGQCCSEIELSWNLRTIHKSGRVMPSPIGKYTKQMLLSNDKVVYYNTEGEYYLYSRGYEWVVSILV